MECTKVMRQSSMKIKVTSEKARLDSQSIMSNRVKNSVNDSQKLKSRVKFLDYDSNKPIT